MNTNKNARLKFARRLEIVLAAVRGSLRTVRGARRARRQHANAPQVDGAPLSIWHRSRGGTVYCPYHFSVYGHQEQKKQQQIAEIRALLAQL